MASLEVHATSVLKGLRALVGEVAFRAAVAALDSDEGSAPLSAPLVAASEPKKKRTRNITEEQRAVITRNMTGLQEFTKTVRAEMGAEVAYKDVKKAAGERWKAMTKEEKEAWMVAHLDGAAAAPVAEPEPVSVAPAPEPKTRGRPKKDAKVTVHKE